MNKVAFFWENPKTDLWSNGFFPTKTTEDPKKDLLPWQRHVLVLLVMRKIEGKKQHTDPREEDNKEKQHKLYVWIYEMYIFRLETQTFLE